MKFHFASTEAIITIFAVGTGANFVGHWSPETARYHLFSLSARKEKIKLMKDSPV
jgi:hypothetical protein